MMESCVQQLKQSFLWTLVLLHILKVNGKFYQNSLTTMVFAGKQDCYFIPNVTQGRQIDLEFQVIDTGFTTGNMDINLYIFDANHSKLQTYHKEPSGNYVDETRVSGDYKFCLDNTYSTISDKQVYVEVFVKNPPSSKHKGEKEEVDSYEYDDDDIDSEEMEEMKQRDFGSELEFDMTVEEIKEKVARIRASVLQAKHQQELVSVSYSRDIHSATNNLLKVNLWSLVHLAILVVTGLVQVIVLKSLFDDKYTVHSMFNKD